MNITIPALFDAHVHLRQGELLRQVAPASARCCARLLAMPNTIPPVADVQSAQEYSTLLGQHLPGVDVLLAVKLLPTTTPQLVQEVAEVPGVVAFKLYPAGATTHSQDGIPHEVLERPEQHTWLGDLLEVMSQKNLVLCLHGEMPKQPDPLQREPAFIHFVYWVLDRFPRLRVVLEHITTIDAVEFVRRRAQRGNSIVATITLHHLMLHLGHVLGSACDDDLGYADGKLHPHNFCWPVPKRPRDREALLQAAISGETWFFLGSDSAPHSVESKESDCGCAGVFSAPVLPEGLVQVFEEHAALDRLPDFVMHHASRFYQRPSIQKSLRLVRQAWQVPARMGSLGSSITPFLAGRTLNWRLD